MNVVRQKTRPDPVVFFLTTAWLDNEDNQGKPFSSYAKMLKHAGKAEGESAYSWTIDFAKRRTDAHEAMQPHLDEVKRIKEDVIVLKEKLKQLKKDKADKKKVQELDLKIKEQEKFAKEAQSKADDIDAAVFDLKAVNPNIVVKVDTRTPTEIIEAIETNSKIITDSLTKLKKLINTN